MSETLINSLIMASILIFMGVTMGITPYIVRKNVFFGVTLPESANNRADIRLFKRQFLIVNILLSLIGIASLFLVFLFDFTVEQQNYFVIWSGIISLIVFMIMSFMSYYYFYRKVTKLKVREFNTMKDQSDARLMVATNFRKGDKPLIIANKWLIGLGLIITVITAGAPILYFDSIPDQVPTNFDFSGNPTVFIDKSVGVFMIIPIIQILTLPLMILSNYGIKGAKQNVKLKSPHVSLEQNRAYRYAWSKYMVSVTIITLIILGCVQLAMMNLFIDMKMFLIIILALMVLLLGGTFYLMIKYGQGGERYQGKNVEQKEGINQTIDEDIYWKLGIFYYNPNDPSVFIEKRFGIGTTFNYARWQTWGIMFGIIIVTIIMTVLPLWLM